MVGENIIGWENAPTDPVWVYDVNVKSKDVLAEHSHVAKVVKIQYTVSPNDLTYILNSGTYEDFNENYYYEGRKIESSEFENLKSEIEEVPIKRVSTGRLENTQMRPITPPTKGGTNWIDRGESNKITFTATLVEKNPGRSLCEFETGSNSLSWTVTPETDWWDVSSPSENNVLTTINNGQLELSGENAALWMPFDNFPSGFGSTDNTVYDLTSYQNDGTAYGGPTITAGKWDNALDFDGADDYVNVPTSPELHPEYVTVLVWMKSPSSTWNTWAGVDISNDKDYDYRLLSESSETGFQVAIVVGGTTSTSGFIAVDDITNWHLYGLTYDGETQKAWYDDTKVYSDTSPSGPLTNGTRDLVIGKQDTLARYLEGKMDEVRIYDRALSENEIKRIYNRTKPSDFDPPGDSILEGTWKSIVKDMSDVKQHLDNVELTSSSGANENILACLGVDTGDDGTIDDNTGWTNVDGMSTWTPTVSDGYRYQLSFKLQTDNTTHSPNVSSFTLNTNEPPNVPVNLKPSGIQRFSDDDLYKDIELSADITDPEGDNINAHFYDNANDNLIDNVWIGSGGTATVTWENLERWEYHSFYVNGRDNTGGVQGENSEVQTFAVADKLAGPFIVNSEDHTGMLGVMLGTIGFVFAVIALVGVKYTTERSL